MRSRRLPIPEFSLLGGAALLLATSCTPGASSPPLAAAAPPHRVADARAMLRKLALDVPADVAEAPDAPLTTLATTLAAPRFQVAAPPFVASAAPDAAARAADCLTAAVYYEARSEPVDGQRAVAQVVLNRVRDRAFPASVCGVVYQRPSRGPGCQFSFVCDGSMDRPRDGSAWERARAVAAAALAGDVFAPIGAATYYHAARILPWWAASMARVGAIGAHVFYRWSAGMERALAFRQTYAGAEPLPGRPIELASAEQAGVAVHRGVDVDGGVAVHYGLATAAAAQPTPQPVRTASEPDGRDATIAGVTLHLGTPRITAAATSPADPS